MPTGGSDSGWPAHEELQEPRDEQGEGKEEREEEKEEGEDRI